MSCGVPVLSFKKTALLSLVKENINGFKVDNFFELKNRINELILFSNSKKKNLLPQHINFLKNIILKKLKKNGLKLFQNEKKIK